jgi:microcystin-dependent protein
MKRTLPFNTKRAGRLFGACLVSVFCAMALSAHAAPTPPDRMTYQGYLVEENGTPLGDDSPENYDVIFSIFQEQTGGEALWAEQQTVTVDKGYFSVLLGEGTEALGGGSRSLPDVFSRENVSERYVEITVKGIGSGGADVPIQPRLRLVSSPYAFQATRAGILMDDAGEDMVTVSSGSGISVNGSVSATAVSASTTLTVPTVNATTVNATAGHGIIPLGGIIMWSGSDASIPAGWALCNGQTVNGRTTPNLRDRFIVGSGAGSSYGTGTVGGFTHVTLTEAQMPYHDHDGWTRSGDGAHSHTGNAHSWADNDDNDSPAVYIRSSTYHGEPGGGGIGPTGSAHRHYFDSPKKGSSNSHENRPPYYALAFIMRVQ